MIDTDTPYMPGWWIKVLANKLHDRRTGRAGGKTWTRDQVESSRVRPPLDVLWDYRMGDPPLRDDIHSGWAEPFRQYVRMGRLNLADLLVTSQTNRLGIRDFRTAAASDELGDVRARDIMRRNELKLKAREVHDYMVSLADGYVMVTPPDDTRPWSLITAESPMQVITAHDAATGETLAALKLFRDEWDGYDWAYLFLPGELWVARKTKGATSIGRKGPFRMNNKDWEWYEPGFDDVPDNRIPIVRFRNKLGVGDFENHLDHLDRINDKIFNEWWISKIQAFRQRALEMADEDEDIDEGEIPTVEELSQMFTTSPDALWMLPKGAKIWESATVDVGPMVNSIQKELQWLAIATKKPLHTITPDAANGSAEGASTMKEEHIYSVEETRDHAEGGWAHVMSLAFLFEGDTQRADITQIEPIWGPVERYSLQEKSEAASKAGTSLPREAIQRDIWQYAPAEIPNLRTMSGADLLFQQPGQPAQPAVTAPPVPSQQG